MALVLTSNVIDTSLNVDEDDIPQKPYLYRNYLKGTEENTFTSIKEYPEPLNNIKEIPDKATLQIKLFSDSDSDSDSDHGTDTGPEPDHETDSDFEKIDSNSL